MICTPIFINTFVVFVRLYWFERRFQNVVRESRNIRRTRSRTKTEAKEDLNPGKTERGVRGRSIVVMHNPPDTNGRDGGPVVKPDLTEGSRTASSSSQGEKTEALDHAQSPTLQQPPTFRRDITFADEVRRPDDDDSLPTMLPQRLSPEQHIEFLENQRNPKDKGALRIPGPRDFDRGRLPEPLEEDDGGQLCHQITSPVENTGAMNGNVVKRNVTIDEPDHPRLRTDTGTFPRLSTRKSGNIDTANATPTEPLTPARLRARTGTFSSLKGWGTKENEPATPYLSWQPTIGRNSAFVDLTEEQREELGGIEYRALKTLAVVLVGGSGLFSRQFAGFD